jgi:hypothetical protein
VAGDIVHDFKSTFGETPGVRDLFDCLFLNGDSYSALSLDRITYGEFLSQKLNVSLINKAVLGSNNDRIIRSSIESIADLLEAGRTPFVIIGLSFIRRIEVWYYGKNKYLLSKIPDCNSNQAPKINLITLDHLISANEITTGQKELFIETTDTLHKRFIDFYMNLFLFCNWLEKLNLRYFIFSPASNVECTAYSLNISELVFIDWCNSNPNIWKLNDFCFLDWAKEHDKDADITGHLSTHGHKKFADILLTNLNLPSGEPNGNI